MVKSFRLLSSLLSYLTFDNEKSWVILVKIDSNWRSIVLTSVPSGSVNFWKNILNLCLVPELHAFNFEKISYPIIIYYLYFTINLWTLKEKYHFHLNGSSLWLDEGYLFFVDEFVTNKSWPPNLSLIGLWVGIFPVLLSVTFADKGRS